MRPTICLLYPVSKFRYTYFMLLISLLPIAAHAQLIAINDIHKIVIKTTSGGMGGSVSSTFEIKKKNNVWVSNRTKKVSNLMSLQTAKWETKDSTDVKFIKTMGQSSIDKMVYAINHPIRTFNPTLFGITAELLRTNADSLLKTVLHQADQRQTAIFKRAITTDRINQAIIKSQSESLMDVSADYVINIVKTNGDTLKIESTNLTGYVLPWKLNKKHAIYNVSISRFCADAMGVNNQDPVNGGDIYHLICEDIYDTYCKGQITAKFFENKYPEAFRLLKSYYSITDINTSDILQDTDPIVFMTLHAPGLPDIYTALHIAHKGDVLRLTKFKAKVDSLFKHKNFIFNYASRTPGCRLIFQDPNDSLSTYAWEQSTYPYLNAYPQQTVTEFRVQNNTGENGFSTWCILPNGQVVLTFFNGSKILNFSKKDLGLDWMPEPGGQVCIIFDADGKIINNLTR